jgi:N-methylhydantoinase A
MIIGVDTGGTFTDFVLLHPDGLLSTRKVPSTPDDPSRAILHGILQDSPEAGFSVVHGTTVATNALLERRGAKTALITTGGCRDVLEIARQTRTELYSLCPSPRQPLIPRALRFEVPERLDWQGRVVRPLDVEAVDRTLDILEAQGVDSLAVCFLFSFLDPAHEQEVGQRARERGLRVSLSSDIAPEVREYERTSTVCANAFVAPVMGAYIDRLHARMVEAGARSLSVMQSNGGTLRADEAASNAIKTVLSGPAGGLVAAARIARQAGFERIMTFDMGGTSTDVALVDGEPQTVRTGEVAGLPLLTPMLDIHTVGTGGGSLARPDTAGGLKVGPQSAGADPGPVAYGKGTELTVTDANVLLGRLPASVRLAGKLPLDAERVRAHFGPLASRMGLTPERAADGVIDVVNAQMARALRHISTERGRDPADYTFVSFGGAGGLHACALAEALGMRRILVPRYPGAFSALGLALADVRREYAHSLFVRVEEVSAPAVASALEVLRIRALHEMQAEGIRRKLLVLSPFVEARYVGQSYSLRVPFRGRLYAVAVAFHRAHRARYDHADPSEPVELVAVGLTAVGQTGSRTILQPADSAESVATASSITRAWVGGRWTDCLLMARHELAAGATFDGPAIVVHEDATTLIEPGWSATADPFGNLILQRS